MGPVQSSINSGITGLGFLMTQTQWYKDKSKINALEQKYKKTEKEMKQFDSLSEIDLENNVPGTDKETYKKYAKSYDQSASIASRGIENAKELFSEKPTLENYEKIRYMENQRQMNRDAIKTIEKELGEISAAEKAERKLKAKADAKNAQKASREIAKEQLKEGGNL